jgi:hypothetical protein
MGILRPYMLASMIAGLALPAGIADAQSPTVSIETEYLMTFEAPLDPAQVVGPHVIFNVPAGGTVHGPQINGSLIPPSGDWLVRMPDGTARLDVRATIKTDDGEIIFIEYGGVVAASEEVRERWRKGEEITLKDEYFITAPRFNLQGLKMVKSRQVL